MGALLRELRYVLPAALRPCCDRTVSNELVMLSVGMGDSEHAPSCFKRSLELPLRLGVLMSADEGSRPDCAQHSAARRLHPQYPRLDGVHLA